MNLVTGGTGLVGMHLLLFLLEQNQQVRAIYRFQKNIDKVRRFFDERDKLVWFEQIEWVEADITDVLALELAFKNISFVYHCAAVVSLSRSDRELYKINIEGTANIVNLCLDFQVKKMCYVSSIAALGTYEDKDTPIDEEAEWNPNEEHSDYAITKHGGEMEVFRGGQEGLEVVVVNPGVIIESVIKGKDSNLLKSLSQFRRFYTLGSMGFVTVTDVVRAMVILMQSKIKSEKFILVGQNISFKQFLTYVAQATGESNPQWYISPFCTGFLALVDKILSMMCVKKRGFTHQMHKTLHSQTIYSSEKFKKTFSFEFTDIEVYMKKDF